MVSTEMTDGSGSIGVEGTAACSESVGVQGQAHAVGFRRIGQMWRGKRLSRRAKGVGVAIAGGVLVAVIAGASIPDSNGVIHGCYKKSGGQVRILDTDIESCKLDETHISWNAAGAGVSGYEVLQADGNQTVRPGEQNSFTVFCSSGKKPVGGGYTSSGSSIAVVANLPLFIPSQQAFGWSVAIYNGGTDTVMFRTWAICVAA